MQQCFDHGQRLVQFAGILAAAAGVVRFAAAFAADNRRNLLNDFAGLNLPDEIRRDRRDERHASRAANRRQEQSRP